MMKRILGVFLCVVLLASTALLFSACGGKATLDEYSIVYAKDASTTMIKAANALADSIKSATGKTVSVLSEEEAAADNKLEILIGQTTRTESEKALKKVSGHGYFYGMVGKKIVLNGTTNLFALQAVEAFAEKYAADMGAAIKIEDTVVDGIEVVQLSSSYNMIVSQYSYGVGSFGESLDKENTKRYDYARWVATKAVNQNASYLGQMKVLNDTQAVGSKEILIGVTTRPETVALLGELDVNDYAIRIADGKIVVAAYSDSMLAMAMQVFSDMLIDGRCEDDKGKTRIMLPVSYEKKVVGNKGWVTDFPRPTGTGVDLTAAADVYDSSLEFLYTGSGVNAAAYNAYCEALEAAGYTLHGDENKAEDSIFRTYVNTAKSTTLYVAFNAFKHAQTTTPKVTAHVPCIRVISAPLGAVNLLDENMLSAQTYVKRTETMITNVRLEGGTDNNAGNLYVVTLEDGTFAVLDGGSGNTTQIAQRLRGVLYELYNKVWGHAPTADNPITISMWYLTHGHGDHSAGFVAFCDNQEYRNDVVIQRVVTNFPADYEVFNGCDINLSVRDNFMLRLRNYYPELKYYKVHTGQTFWLANSKFEVLYTHEDLQPWSMQYYNDSGVVMRQTIYDTNGAVGSSTTANKTATPTTMLWLGDAQNMPSAYMRAMWGSYLKSDMVQVAHHGAMGCEYPFYELVKPDILWWPTNMADFYNILSHSNASHYYNTVNAKLVYELASVDWIILGSTNTTMTITKNGPDVTTGGSGSALFDASAGEYFADSPLMKTER